MKKLFIFSFVLAVTMGMIYSAGLNVTSPSGGTWYKGTTHNITWSPSACTSTNYKINIFKNTTDPANFVEQLVASGVNTKSWTVPMSYTNGTYIIRVKADDNSCFGDSAAFQIADSGGTPGSNSITVTNPNGSTQWCRGETKTITWTSSGSLDANVKINIFRGSLDPANFVTQLTQTTACGAADWAIPASATTGTYYVRVKEAVGTVYGDSPGFQVKDCGGTSPSGSSCAPFIVYKPAKNDSHLIGFPMEVKWKYKLQVLPGTLQAKVAVQKVPQNKLIQQPRELSKVKMVKIEIKSVKCFNIAQYVPVLKSIYSQKKVALEKVKILMDMPWYYEILKWKTLKSMTPDDGSEVVTIPASYKKGCYVIRVTKLWCDASDNDRTAVSNSFTLAPLTIPGWYLEKIKFKKDLVEAD